MPENWKTYKLEDLTTRVTVGFVGSMAQEYVEDGIPMLRSQNIRPFCLDYANLKYISPIFHEKIRKSSLKKDDVAIVRTGNPGTACVIPEGIPELNCSDLVIATPDKSKIDPHFLSFYFNSIASNYINSELVGAVQQHFNVGSAKKMEIKLPEIKEQHKIVSILKAIQDKIELNLQMNKTLEEMAMALYNHWFVDFGPFQNGKFVDSELGKIPKGWEVKSIYSLANYINGAAFKTSDFKEEGLSVIKIAELRNGISYNTKKSNKKIKDELILKDGAVLFSWSATLDIFLWDKGEALLNQHIFNVIANGSITLKTLYFILKNVIKQFQAIAADRATTMGHIKISHLKETFVTVPDSKTLKGFEETFHNIFDKILNNSLENQNLTQLRDTLLPKLISGEVRVKDVEKTLSEVL